MKNIIFWMVMAGMALVIWFVVRSSSHERVTTLTFTQFSQEIDHDNVHEVTIAGSDVNGIFRVHGVLKKGNAPFSTAAPANYTDWLKVLNEKNVSIVFEDSKDTSWMTWIANGMPMLLLLGLWIFFMRQMQRNRRTDQQPPAPGNAKTS